MNLADVCVVHGKAYYYFAAGTTFVWRASEVVEIPDSEDDPPPASDQDQLPDAWEQQWFGNLAQGDEDDPDDRKQQPVPRHEAHRRQRRAQW